MWIDKAQVGARTSLGVLGVLTIVTQLVGVVSLGNGLEGVLAIDIWIAVCMLFTIMALCVFAVVHNMKRRRDKAKSKYQVQIKPYCLSTPVIINESSYATGLLSSSLYLYMTYEHLF